MLYKNVLFSSLVMAFAGMGDTILYLVLPIYGESLGFSAWWIGVFLSINRLVRIPAHGLISHILSKLGYRKSMILASIFALISTLSYGIIIQAFAFALFRILWGISFALLRLSSIAYATEHKTNSEKFLGINTGIKTLGALCAIYIGQELSVKLDLNELFVFVGIISSISILLSYKLPEIQQDIIDIPILKSLKLGRINQIAWVTAFIVDGVVVVGLSGIFLADSIETLTVLVGTFLILKKILYSILGFVSGWLVVHFGLSRVLIFSLLNMMIGIFLIILDFPKMGVVFLFFSNGLVSAILPMLAIYQSNLNRLQSVGSVTLWWDLGAATGSLVGLPLVSTISNQLLFCIFGILLIYIMLQTIFYFCKKEKYERI